MGPNHAQGVAVRSARLVVEPQVEVPQGCGVEPQRESDMVCSFVFFVGLKR